MEEKFYERFPKEFLETAGGSPIFSPVAHISELHEQHLDMMYFPVVGHVMKFPRYVNKREIDPFVKCFVDETGQLMNDNWGLPIPNAVAAYKSLAKYGKAEPWLDVEQVKLLNKAWLMAVAHFGPYMGNSRVRTVQEVLDNLDMSTSSGAPWCMVHKTKKELLKKYPQLVEWLEADYIRMIMDDNWTFIFTNSLKEEVRPEEKIRLNKIRTFLSGGIDGVVHGNRLFADMNEKMNASHLRTASSIGLSPYYGGWDQLFNKLNVFKNGFALDESEYDSSLRRYLMWGCAWFRWKMLQPEDQTPDNLKRIKVYYRNLIYSLIISPEGVLLLKQLGNTSGSVNTVNDNTIILYVLMCYGWLRTTPEPLHSLSAFEEHTAKVLLGDDNTWTVSDYACQFYNARSIIEVWKELGITTTTDCLEPRLAQDLDFLSANTVFMKGRAVPLYNKEKLMTSLLYAPKLDHDPAITLQRTYALLNVGWVDLEYRRFSRALASWLLQHFDEVLCNDLKWILAKTMYKSDDELSYLFLGSGKPVRCALPDKNYTEMSAQGRNFNSGTKPVKKTTQQRNAIAGQQSRNGGNQQTQVTLSKKKRGATRPKPVQGPLRQNGQPIPRPKRRNPNRKRSTLKKGQILTVTGKGDYSLARAGEQAGGWLGQGAENFINTVFGFGEYEMLPKKNNLMGLIASQGTDPPAVRNPARMGVEGFQICHREYVGELTSGHFDADHPTSTVFDLKTFPLNPGNGELFPFVAAIAHNFQEWEADGILVELKSEASEYASQTSLGTIFSAVDYNALAPPPDTKKELENMEWAMSQKSSNSLVMPIECARQMDVMTHLYVAQDENYLLGDPRFYNLGNLHIGSEGIQSETARLAEVWVTYCFTFFKPKISTIANGVWAQFVGDVTEFSNTGGHTTSNLLWKTYDYEQSVLDRVTRDPFKMFNQITAPNSDNNIVFNHEVVGGKTFLITVHADGEGDSDATLNTDSNPTWNVVGGSVVSDTVCGNTGAYSSSKIRSASSPVLGTPVTGGHCTAFATSAVIHFSDKEEVHSINVTFPWGSTTSLVDLSAMKEGWNFDYLVIQVPTTLASAWGITPNFGRVLMSATDVRLEHEVDGLQKQINQISQDKEEMKQWMLEFMRNLPSHPPTDVNQCTQQTQTMRLAADVLSSGIPQLDAKPTSRPNSFNGRAPY